MKKQLFLTVVTLFLTSAICAQDFSEKYEKASAKKDTAAQRKVMEAWVKQGDESVSFYQNAGIYYTGNPETEQKGVDYLNLGIAKYPDLYLMRFSKVQILSLVQAYEQMAEEIVRTIEYSVKINNSWDWGDGKKGGKNIDVNGNPKGFCCLIFKVLQCDYCRSKMRI